MFPWETRMKIVPGLAAMFVLTSLSAYAQVPQGSYLRSCRDIKMQGQTLAAVCRRADGREQSSSLAEVHRCTGDIGNINGVLQCNRGSGPAPGAPAPGYLPPRGEAPPPGYPPPPGYGGDRQRSDEQAYRERCERLGHEERELRGRLQYTPYGEERERLQYRLG